MSAASLGENRYSTCLSLPRHLIEHVKRQAALHGMPQAAYVRSLIYKDLQATEERAASIKG